MFMMAKAGLFRSLAGTVCFTIPADRWPEAVDLPVATKWVKAFTQLAVAEAGDSNG